MKHTVKKIATPDGISWHVEQFVPEPSDSQAKMEHIALIPSGEGDCQTLVKVASILASKYHYLVTTFDNPGFSRTEAPLSAYDVVTGPLMASQVHTLLKHLGVKRTSAFGCSSGGHAVLGLIGHDSAFVKAGIIHEIPLANHGKFIDVWKSLSDAEISTLCASLFREQFVSDRQDLWDDLGPEYHARLSKNFVTWVKHFDKLVPRESVLLPALKSRPVYWTVGSLNPDRENGYWKENFHLAREAGFEVNGERLKSLHFPSISVPEDLAAWIAECIEKTE